MVYKAGDKPGPGRGNKKPHPIDGLDFWDSTRLMIREALKSKEVKVWLNATKLYMTWYDLKAKHEAKGATGDQVIDPGVQAMLGDAVERLLSGDLPELDEDFLDD